MKRLFRTLSVLIRLTPFVIAFLRDRRGWILFGRPAKRTVEQHQRRADKLRGRVAGLGPTFIKLAQLFSSRADILPEPYLSQISKLQDQVPADPVDEIVHVVDTIVQTLPEGVFYTAIRQKGTGFTMLGVAQSNARVSSLMRALESSEWFHNPNLVEIKATPQPTSTGGESDIKLSNFNLNVTQTVKKKTEEEAAGGKS